MATGSGKCFQFDPAKRCIDFCRDEILYHAKLHPEQYSNTFSTAQLKQLHTSILYVTKTAVDLLADSSKFPNEWLFNHRWGKGKKDAATKLPNGAAITFLTVGGRTSCVVPSVQKKTGAVTADVDVEGEISGKGSKPTEKKSESKSKSKKRKLLPEVVEIEFEESDIEPDPKIASRKGRKPKKEDVDAVKEEEKVDEKSSKRFKPVGNKKVKKEEVTERRRSGRAIKG